MAPVASELPVLTPLRSAICAAHRCAEASSILPLCDRLTSSAQDYAAAQPQAAAWVTQLRAARVHTPGIDALMREFSLSSDEGVALMCLAEALLRIPDDATRDALIRDKIGQGNWQRHLGHSRSLFVNAAAWGLLISGKLVATRSEQGFFNTLNQLLAKGGEPLIRAALNLTVRLLGRQFVAGETIQAALAQAAPLQARGYRYSYDMLGEAALTSMQAQHYCDAYTAALHAIGAAAESQAQRIEERPGISIKLSALHPRYEYTQRARVLSELLPRLKMLAQLAASYRLSLNIDAEESERLELSLDLFEALALDPELRDWQGLGFVVQAYQKRASAVVDWLLDLAQRSGHRLMVRLVKGAYWDSEIKRTQVEGQSDYPVFTRKAHTDVSYLACAEQLLRAGNAVYPQFATHNALTLCTVQAMAKRLHRQRNQYEFQCLHGMGEPLYDRAMQEEVNLHCRIYAPVGSHATLLPYLVRRLLENGANNSFVHQLVDESLPLAALLADPVASARRDQGQPHPAIPLPVMLYGSTRENSSGLDLADTAELTRVQRQLRLAADRQWQAAPLLAGVAQPASEAAVPVCNPAWQGDHVGSVSAATREQVSYALASAQQGAALWRQTAPQQRARCLRQWAALLQAHQTELWALCQREAGKTLPNAIGEVREAIDFCRYTAQQVEALEQQGSLGAPLGIAVCISPWNFPLAIFTGQIAAALAAGNAVLAKPAQQTPLIAARAVELARLAGIPPAALQLLPGPGATVGQWLVEDARIAAVLFTGSTDVAQQINRTLAQRADEAVLIAETGGQNAMIVDSSALPEQVVQDVLASAFDSAGQRCSALRVLCVQEEIADELIGTLKGAMSQLVVGMPLQLATDVGPVIGHAAQQRIEAHIAELQQQGCAVSRSKVAAGLPEENFVVPTLIEIPQLALLTHEVFGPVLHVLRFARDELPQLLDDINATGYGLTFGMHSRISETIALCVEKIRAGNIYVNRNLIGAVVGVQPFGGSGLSGTGPKAGGPLYLPRLMRLTPQQQEQINQSCHHVTTLLPGPVGEDNEWSLRPRGRVGCVAATPAELMQLIDWVARTGNHPVVESAQARALQMADPKHWPALKQRIRVTEALDRADILTDIDAVVTTTHHAHTLRQSLAARDGALVPLIRFDLNQDYAQQPLWRLYAEKTVSVNTAAAGGNASLLALG
ncbi:MAG: bifunctional proline dehydrogenase/L-glutamate gamma-semialdehyde dehydrogenase PutA [Burkholderiaceae bacterium]|nr:MAG: bifunctional proline dehydrogenase/L-glutamate gamma-semialdehyde dehydrogenase PutA [Burkholderiaceae bacterium]